jgi:hypothetical protein
MTKEQKEILVEFMRTHPELISGKFSAKRVESVKKGNFSYSLL